MKRVTAAVAAGLLLVGVAGCSTVNSKAEENELDERTITLSDGRELTCVARTAGYKGGLSCDWDGAK